MFLAAFSQTPPPPQPAPPTRPRQTANLLLPAAVLGAGCWALGAATLAPLRLPAARCSPLGPSGPPLLLSSAGRAAPRFPPLGCHPVPRSPPLSTAPAPAIGLPCGFPAARGRSGGRGSHPGCVSHPGCLWVSPQRAFPREHAARSEQHGGFSRHVLHHPCLLHTRTRRLCPVLCWGAGGGAASVDPAAGLLSGPPSALPAPLPWPGRFSSLGSSRRCHSQGRCHSLRWLSWDPPQRCRHHPSLGAAP